MVDAAKNAIRSFSTVDNDAARTNVARYFAIELTLRTGDEWNSLIDDEPKVVAALALCLPSAGRRKTTEIGLLAHLSRGLRVLNLEPKADVRAAADSIRQRVKRQR